MTLSYQLNENDFLQHQLFVASQSASLKKRRKSSLVVLIFCFVMLSLLFYLIDENLLAILMLLLAPVTFFFFPSFQGKQLHKAYKRSINENYKNRFGKQVQVGFTDDAIVYHDSNSEVKILLTTISKIIELQDLFIIQMSTGGGLIMPKQQLEDVVGVRQLLQEVSQKLSVPFVQEFSWKWK
ncbi:MAG: YcxB family protein [Niastella sp.]|nr:YcxB family protein [Niastella sp.]